MEKIIKNEEFTFRSRQKEIELLTEKYPFVKKISIGQSVMGKDISALVIGQGQNPTLITGGFKGIDRVTSTVLMMFADELCSSINNNTPLAGINVKKVLENRSVIIVPTVNPDGCEIAYLGEKGAGAYSREIARISMGKPETIECNLRGVDINLNFLPQEDNVGKPSFAGYGGPYSESEPETAALTSLCRKIKIRQLISLHMGKGHIFYPITENMPERNESMLDVLSETSGYITVGSSVDNDFSMWFALNFKRPAFSVKVRQTPSNKAEELYEMLKEMLTISLLL